MASFCRYSVCGCFPEKTSRQSCNSVSPSQVNSLPKSTDSDYRNKTQAKRSIRKHSKWQILKQKCTKVGVVPVDVDHVHYRLLSCIQQGLRQVVLEKPLAAKNALTPTDFLDVTRSSIIFDGQEFEFESYAGAVFATLRQSVGVDEQHYLAAVALSSKPYLEFKCNSKSGEIFFFSHDTQFIFKSNRRRDVTFFLAILPKYLQHFISYPHSLLVKYVGCYTIKMKGRSKKYFLAMQSIFYPADRIEDRYDIKGCLAGRYQEPEDPDSHNISILKDQNFENEKLDFGAQAEWFMMQITVDTQFLSDLNCMDYSLLIGRQKKHADETATETIYTIINRTGQSISPTKKSGQPYSNLRSHSDEVDIKSNNLQGMTVKQSAGLQIDSTSICDDITKMAKPTTVILPPVKPGIMFPRNLADGVDKFQEEHRRLLLRCQNELHIMDGKDIRYFLGIVDFLTRFDCRQKTAQCFKMVKYCGGDHSTQRPDVYQQRFVSFLQDRVT